MLQRWQSVLKSKDYQAIYFNAWEDDFSNDPLLAIIGQLCNHFKDAGLRRMAEEVARFALPLIKDNLLGVLKAATGLHVNPDVKKGRKATLLDTYLNQNATKDQLKNELAKLSKKVADRTSHPLVFIIDELDRCRPTFAIELLERVKHIFDVPNMVFVFGLNRDELCKSLASVYGDIKTDVYLRRFFDFEFNLPESNSQGFALHLIDRFQIGEAFNSLSGASGDPVHKYDYDNYRRVLPRLWSAFGLSLRDIDYGIRLLAFLAKNVREHVYTHPYLLTLLIGMRFKDADLYPTLIKGNFRASEIMDYIYDDIGQRLLEQELFNDLCRIEGFLYCTDSTNTLSEENGEKARVELTRVLNGQMDKPFNIISRRAQSAEKWPLSLIVQAIQDGRKMGVTRKVFSNLASLVDLYQTELRR